jgi:hypothetical protein
MAETMGTGFSLCVPGLSSDTGYSGSTRAGWFTDRTDGSSLSRAVPEVRDTLLVGDRKPAIELERPSSLQRFVASTAVFQAQYLPSHHANAFEERMSAGGIFSAARR